MWGPSSSPCLPPHIQHPVEGLGRLQPIPGRTAAISDHGDRGGAGQEVLEFCWSKELREPSLRWEASKGLTSCWN